MGPPDTSREVRRYLQRNQSGLADECVDRLLNFGLLSDDEALRFMATENGEYGILLARTRRSPME